MYLITIHQRYRRTDGQTDDIRQQYRSFGPRTSVRLSYKATRDTSRSQIIHFRYSIIADGRRLCRSSGRIPFF